MADRKNIADSHALGDYMFCWGCMSTVSFEISGHNGDKMVTMAHCDCTKKRWDEPLWTQWTPAEEMGVPI